jgi:hypothetical protein
MWLWAWWRYHHLVQPCQEESDLGRCDWHGLPGAGASNATVCENQSEGFTYFETTFPSKHTHWIYCQHLLLEHRWITSMFLVYIFPYCWTNALKRGSWNVWPFILKFILKQLSGRKVTKQNFLMQGLYLETSSQCPCQEEMGSRLSLLLWWHHKHLQTWGLHATDLHSVSPTRASHQCQSDNFRNPRIRVKKDAKKVELHQLTHSF